MFLDSCIHQGDIRSKLCSFLKSEFIFAGNVIHILHLYMNDSCIYGSVNISDFLPFSSSYPLLYMKACSTKTDAGTLDWVKLWSEDGISVHFSDLLTKFSVSNFHFGGIINSILSSIGLADIKLSVNSIGFNINPLAVIISGHVDLGYSTLFNFNIVMGNIDRIVLSLDIELNSGAINNALEDIVKKVFGKTASMLDIFSFTVLRLCLSTASVNLEKIPALSFGNDMVFINKGFSVEIDMQFNSVTRNPLIKIFASLVKGPLKNSFILTEDTVSMSLELPPITLSKSVVWLNTKLYFVTSFVNPKISFGISTTIGVVMASSSTGQLDFNAAISFSPTDESITVALSMMGDWVGAFGFKSLKISNVVGSVSVIFVPPYLTALALGGAVQIGSSDSTIKGTLYLRVDLEGKF